MKTIKERKILIIDDEVQLLEMIKFIFNKEGYHNIDTASSCSEGLEKLKTNKSEIIILDVMLKDGDGFSLINEIRKIREVPVIFLTAKGEADDKILGLGLGADDYVVKPFLPKELVLRVNAVLKRTYVNKIQDESSRVIHLECCTIDLNKAEIIRDNTKTYLTAKEYAILNKLFENANNIVTIDTLCDCAWEGESFGYEKTLMVHIRHIREKIEKDPSKPKSLLTVKGLGYTLSIRSGA